MLKVIKELLLKIIDSIDAGNSNITEKEAFEIIDIIKRYTDTTQYYNRTQAAKYLNCSVQSFDLYRKEGKIPEGIKQAGGVRQWTKQQLDKYINSYRIFLPSFLYKSNDYTLQLRYLAA